MIGGYIIKKINVIRFVCVGGMLTALTVLFQAAPVFLPAIGLVLSPFSTLPIVIAAASNILLGVSVLFSSAIILTLVSVQEALILLFTTGLLGIVMGALITRKCLLFSIFFSGLSLFLGLIFLTYIVGVPAFVELANSLSTLITLFAFFIFSLVYASIWNIGLKKYINYLKKIIMEGQ